MTGLEDPKPTYLTNPFGTLVPTLPDRYHASQVTEPSPMTGRSTNSVDAARGASTTTSTPFWQLPRRPMVIPPWSGPCRNPRSGPADASTRTGGIAAPYRTCVLWRATPNRNHHHARGTGRNNQDHDAPRPAEASRVPAGQSQPDANGSSSSGPHDSSRPGVVKSARQSNSWICNRPIRGDDRTAFLTQTRPFDMSDTQCSIPLLFRCASGPRRRVSRRCPALADRFNAHR